jgi:uncharacterized protein YfaS (alpha-2-macroglobulin family)
MLMIACSSGPSTNTANAPVNVANTTSATANANNPLATSKTPEAATSNGAPTLTPVVQAYFDALKKKDDAAVQKLISNDYLKKTEADMKSEKKTGLASYLAEYDGIADKPVEVRNERIEGDKAVAEIKAGNYVNWTKFAFVKEGGTWKFSNESPELQGVPKSK